MQKIDLSEKRFGKLIAKNIDASNKTKPTKWVCDCDCGKTTSVFQSNLTTGKTKSCGCSQWSKKHGKYGTKVYRIWNSMVQRCTNPNDQAWKYYGGRGISVCKEWLKFENFYKDMGDKPIGLTLDRRDNNSGYNKYNCEWVSRKKQSRNTRVNFRLTHKGESLTFIEWSEKTGLSVDCIRGRYRRGWPAEKSLTTERMTEPWNKKNTK